MSNKRLRDETDISEQVHTRHKKLRDDHGLAKRVDSKRYDINQQHQPPFGANINNDADPFGMGMNMRNINNYPLPQSDDDQDIDSPNNNNMQSSKSNDNIDTDLGLLLYELASLDVKGNNGGNNNDESLDQPQTCPICSRRVSLKEFPDHVHSCLDAMDEGDLNDMRTQVERDSDFANAYAKQHGYLTEFQTVCPVCNVGLSLGMAMNEHINRCLDESMKAEQNEMKKNNNNSMNDYDDDEDDDIVRSISPSNRNNNKPKGGVMSREQMIACAAKLQTLRQGSEQFDNMLDMFGALGFNKANVKSVLDIEKKQKNKNNGNGNGNNHNKNNYNNQSNNNQNFNNMNYNNNMNNNPLNNNNFNDGLSPIHEEDDVDLNRNKKSVNFMNDNRNNNQQQMNNDQQYVFDDDDL